MFKRVIPFIITCAMLFALIPSGAGAKIYEPTILLEENFDNDSIFHAGWTTYHGDKITLQSNISLSGKALMFSDDSDTKSVYFYSPNITITGGKEYSISVHAKSATGAMMSFYLLVFDKDGNRILTKSTGTTSYTWTQLNITQTLPDDASYIQAALAMGIPTVGSGYFDDFQVCEGKPFVSRPLNFYAPSQAEPVDGKLVAPSDNKLIYNTYTDKGDKIADFSKAGFYEGLYELPDSAKLPVAATVEPSGDETFDDTARLQKIINDVYDASVDNSFKVIKLKAGRYNINSNGLMLKSGIVLSGEGQGPEGTVLYATDATQYTVLKIQGQAPTLGIKHYITDEYVPSGSNVIHLSDDDIKAYQPGDLITLTHLGTADWCEAIKMTDVYNGNGVNTSWINKSVDVCMERRIVSIEENSVKLDMPVYIPLYKYLSVSYIQKTDDTGRTEHVGIENLRLESYYNGTPDDEEHANNAISFSYAKNCYVRDVSFKYFILYGVFCGARSKQITIKNCSYLEPISTIGGSRRYPFCVHKSSQQILVSGCYAYSGRHDYATSFTASGPIVFADSNSDYSNSQSETHGTWATGILYDNIIQWGSSAGYICVANRGIYGSATSQGWTGAGVIMYNCLAPTILAHNPPLYHNFLIGEWGHYTDVDAQRRKDAIILSQQKMYRTSESETYPESAFVTEANTSFVGDSYKESPTAPVEPRSLYKAQLSERLTGSFKNTKPNAPLITAPRGEEEHKLKSNSVVIKGMYERGAEKVTVYVDNNAYTAQMYSDYTFVLNLTLANGTHKISATQTIGGIEGTKCADRFVVVNEVGENHEYLQSPYEYEKIHPLTNSGIISYDKYQQKSLTTHISVIGKNISAHNFTNNSTLIAASYKQDKLCETKILSVSNGYSANLDDFSLDLSDVSHVKIYLWNGIENLMPLCLSETIYIR